MFEMYYARLIGIAHCIVPQLLPIPVDPQSILIQTPPMDLLASIINPNQQIPLGGSQMPSIIQIIVPGSSLQIPQVIVNDTEESTTVTTSTTTTTTALPLVDDLNETDTTSAAPLEQGTTEEPLRSFVPVSQTEPPTTVLPEPEPEPEKEDEIDDIQLNEDIDSSDDYHDNEEKIKKQRDRSDFRYVESFESEKSILQKFEPDPNDNDTELKNGINESYQPSVLPVPNALSSSKDTENEDHEPPEVLPDQN